MSLLYKKHGRGRSVKTEKFQSGGMFNMMPFAGNTAAGAGKALVSSVYGGLKGDYDKFIKPLYTSTPAPYRPSIERDAGRIGMGGGAPGTWAPDPLNGAPYADPTQSPWTNPERAENIAVNPSPVVPAPVTPDPVVIPGAETVTDPTVTPAPAVTPAPVTPAPAINTGDNTAKIKRIQRMNGITETGVWDPDTMASLKKVKAQQRKLGVKEDGIWGPKSAAAFEKLRKTEMDAEVALKSEKAMKAEADYVAADMASREGFAPTDLKF